MLADAGYCSADNLERADEFSDQHGTEFYVATGRSRRDEPPPVAGGGRIPKSTTSKQRMARTLTPKKGRAIYARRKAIVEPVFAQMSTLQNAKHLLLRGLHQARGEWLLLATCHNLRRANFTASSVFTGSLAPSRRPDQRTRPLPPSPDPPSTPASCTPQHIHRCVMWGSRHTITPASSSC